MKVTLKHIVIAGILVRLLFLLFGAQMYYGRHPFWIHDDSQGWMDSILNLIKTGTYTANPDWVNGVFYRPPGYSFFLGLCYFITGGSVAGAYLCAVILQTAIDVFNIFFGYKIVSHSTGSNTAALLMAGIYALYPFTLVWNGVATAEIMSVSFVFAGLYFYTIPSYRYRYFIAAVFLGLASLTRPQCLVIFPCLLVVEFFAGYRNIKQLSSTVIALCLGFALSYGLWPARNYINQHRLLFVQDANIGNIWSPDWFAFAAYTFSLQTDLEPQVTQLMNGKEIEWPSQAYAFAPDSGSIKLMSHLLDSCGTGISYFRLHKKIIAKPVPAQNNCDSTIANIASMLVAHQKKYNALNYYVKVPLTNLHKSIFKSALYGSQSKMVKTAATILFSIRTMGLLLGLMCSVWLLAKWSRQHKLLWLIILYFCAWYAFMCIVFRNIEVRYLLNADTLLLIPVAIYFGMLIDKIFIPPAAGKKQKERLFSQEST